MSELHEEIVGIAAKYVHGEISIDDFRVAFAPMYVRARYARGDRESNALASRVVGPLAEFSRHHRLEQSLREVLSDAVCVATSDSQR